MKNVKSNPVPSVAITELEQLDLTYVSGGANGPGYIAGVSGDANASGRSCATIGGVLEQVRDWIGL